MRRVLAALIVLCATLPVPVAAQDRPLSLDVRIPRPWFGPSDPLALDVVVRSRTDDRLRDLRISIAVHERARSRSELARAFSARLPVTPLQAFTVRLDEVAPGAARTVGVRKTLESLAGFGGAPAGVYPVTVTVRPPAGRALAQVVTAITFLDGAPRQPVSVLPVLTLFPTALLTPAGPVDGARERLDRMHDLVTAIDGSTGAVAVSPVFLDELELLASGDVQAGEDAGDVRESADRLRTAIRTLAGRSALLRAPYANVELPDAGAGLRAQLTRGDRLLHQRLGVEPQQPLYPPGLAVDDRSLTRAADAGVRAVVVSGSSLGPGVLTPSRPVRLGRLVLLPADAALAGAVSSARTSLEASRVLASTAMIYFESPGRRRALALPIDLTQGRGPEVLASLARAPWVSPLPASAVTGLEADEGDVRDAPPPLPPDDYRRALTSARRAVEGFEGFALEGNPRSWTLRTTLDRARSTADWNGDWERAESWATRIVRAVDEVRDKITATVGPVTFTSRSGEIPVTVANRNDFPIRLRVTLASPKLRFPSGATRSVRRLDPPGETITFRALSESTGTFPLTVAVHSADGDLLLDRSELVVRSTAANVLALVLTLAGAVFLVVSYGRRRVRKKAVAP